MTAEGTWSMGILSPETCEDYQPNKPIRGAIGGMEVDLWNFWLLGQEMSRVTPDDVDGADVSYAHLLKYSCMELFQFALLHVLSTTIWTIRASKLDFPHIRKWASTSCYWLPFLKLGHGLLS